MIPNTVRACSKREQNNRKCLVYTREDSVTSLVSQNKLSKVSGGLHEDIQSKKDVKAKPKLQPKPNLGYFKLQKINLPKTGTITTFQECNESNKDKLFQSETAVSNSDLQKEDRCSQLYKIPKELSDMRGDPREKAGGSYLDIVRKDKNSYELDNYFDIVQYSSTEMESNNPITQGNCEYTQDSNDYLEIEDSQISKYISPIKSFAIKSSSQDDVQSSNHSVSKDMLSEMLYEPVQSIMDEKSSFRKFSAPTIADPTLGSTNIKYEYFVLPINNENEKNVANSSKKQVKQKKQVIKKQTKITQKIAPYSAPQKGYLIFEDFSNNSELARLGEKMREQLENQ